MAFPVADSTIDLLQGMVKFKSTLPKANPIEEFPMSYLKYGKYILEYIYNILKDNPP
jgi:hypothetical protein